MVYNKLELYSIFHPDDNIDYTKVRGQLKGILLCHSVTVLQIF